MPQARRRETSLQEQAEQLQQNMEVALEEAKTAKAHVQELQGMLATAAAEAAATRPRHVEAERREADGGAELKVLKEKLEASRSSKLSLDPGVLSSWLLGYLGFAEESAERDRLKVAELSRALAEAPAVPLMLPAEPVEEPPPDCLVGNGRQRRLCTGSMEALRAHHRCALLRKLHSPSARRAEEADATVAALRRAQRQLRGLEKDLQSQRVSGLNSVTVGTQTETVASTYPSTAKTALVSALASPSRATNGWTGEKQFAADALRHAVFSLSLSSFESATQKNATSCRVLLMGFVKTLSRHGVRNARFRGRRGFAGFMVSKSQRQVSREHTGRLARLSWADGPRGVGLS
eukprot:s2391_g8.t1